MYGNDNYDLFWSEVRGDHEVAQHRTAMVHSKVAASQYWPFLARAVDEADFDNRLSVILSRLEALVVPGTLDEVVSSLRDDYRAVHEAKGSSTEDPDIEEESDDAKDAAEKSTGTDNSSDKTDDDDDDSDDDGDDKGPFGKDGPKAESVDKDSDDKGKKKSLDDDKSDDDSDTTGKGSWDKDNKKWSRDTDVASKKESAKPEMKDWLKDRIGDKKEAIRNTERRIEELYGIKLKADLSPGYGEGYYPDAHALNSTTRPGQVSPWAEQCESCGRDSEGTPRGYIDSTVNPNRVWTRPGIKEPIKHQLCGANEHDSCHLEHAVDDHLRHNQEMQYHATNYQPDPDAGWRYHPGYEQLRQPVNNGELQDSDGFPTDLAQGEGRSNPIIEQRQLTPGQWTEHDGMPERPMPQGTQRGYMPVNASFDKEGFLVESNQYIKQQGGKWVVVQKGTGNVLSHHDSKADAEASFRAMEMHKHEGSLRFDRDGFVVQALVDPAPGTPAKHNPFYFNQTQTNGGNAGFPADPSAEPLSNWENEFYGEVPPVSSSGSSEGTVDGQGYSRTSKLRFDANGFVVESPNFNLAPKGAAHQNPSELGIHFNSGYSHGIQHMLRGVPHQGGDYSAALSGVPMIHRGDYSRGYSTGYDDGEHLKEWGNYDPNHTAESRWNDFTDKVRQFEPSAYNYGGPKTAADRSNYESDTGKYEYDSSAPERPSRSDVIDDRGRKSTGPLPEDPWGTPIRTPEEEEEFWKSSAIVQQCARCGKKIFPGPYGWNSGDGSNKCADRQPHMTEAEVRWHGKTAYLDDHSPKHYQHYYNGYMTAQKGSLAYPPKGQAEGAAYMDGWHNGMHDQDVMRGARKVSSTDGKIVGLCPGCNKAIRKHDTPHGNEFRHLHNDHVRCHGVKKTANPALLLAGEEGAAAAEAAPLMKRVPGLGGGKGHGSNEDDKPSDTWGWDSAVKLAADYLGRPDANNPTGMGPDEYDARTWNAYQKTHPMQSPEDRNVNSPVLPDGPIKTRNINTPNPGTILRDDKLQTTRPEDEDD